MAAAEALMELVPSGQPRRSGPPNTSGVAEVEEEKERAMAATYAAYTKRARLHVEKTKAQQLSRQLKTRLQFARLKVDYGWTRQSLNEVENLYFHLSRARPSSHTHISRTEEASANDTVVGPSTPPTVAATPTGSQDELLVPTECLQNELQLESFISDSSQHPLQTQPKPTSSSLPDPTLSRSLSHPSPTSVKRSPYVERTRTGGLVRSSQPVERLRTGGKVRSSPTGTSPKKRGRPRILDTSESAPIAPVVASTSSRNGTGGTDGPGGLTYDSFWSSLGTMKSPGT